MANCIDKIGAIECIKMKFPNAVIHQVHNLFGRNARRYQLSGLGIVVKPLETVRQRLGYFCVAHRGKFRHLGKIGNGMIPGVIGTSMAAARTLSIKRK